MRKLLALLVALAFPVTPVSGYFLEGPSWPSGSTVTFQLGLGPAGRTLLDGNVSWDVAAAPAFADWDQSLQRVQIISVVNPNPPIQSGDHVNTIAFSNTVFGKSFGTYTLAVTTYWFSGSTMTEADILFNTNQSWDSYRGPLQFGANFMAIGDIRRVLVHELGHALGLAHPDAHGQTVDAIMNAAISDRETTSTDDLTGAQSLYGARVALSIVSSTPLPNGHIVLQCLGVANAINRIEASTDLSLGSFSTVSSITSDGAGAFQYEDMNAASFPARFYRVAYP